jgi:hypothetical protein
MILFEVVHERQDEILFQVLELLHDEVPEDLKICFRDFEVEDEQEVKM